MISRRLTPHLNELLRHSPAVVLLGPRQAGKTTLALEIGEQRASIYLDVTEHYRLCRVEGSQATPEAT
jgi:predicted AAA+ superfamily ATPase